MFGPVAILGDAEPGKTLIARTGGWYCNELMAYALDLPDPWPAHPGALYEALT